MSKRLEAQDKIDRLISDPTTPTWAAKAAQAAYAGDPVDAANVFEHLAAVFGDLCTAILRESITDEEVKANAAWEERGGQR